MYNTPKADMILGNGMYTFMSLYTIVKKRRQSRYDEDVKTHTPSVPK